jgi:hypothetical protein
VSTHGLDVAGAIALARELFAGRASPAVRVVGVRIGLPTRGAVGLSPPVSAAVGLAASVVRARATK